VVGVVFWNGGSSFARMKRAHPDSGWALCSVNDLVYFLDFFAFALIALAATFGFAAFVLIAMDSTPPSTG
jgi:hypothetical protein